VDAGLTDLLEDILGETQHYFPKKNLPKRRKNNYRSGKKITKITSSLRHGDCPANTQGLGTDGWSGNPP
jgi:hypothetical protein